MGVEHLQKGGRRGKGRDAKPAESNDFHLDYFNQSVIIQSFALSARSSALEREELYIQIEVIDPVFVCFFSTELIAYVLPFSFSEVIVPYL